MKKTQIGWATLAVLIILDVLILIASHNLPTILVCAGFTLLMIILMGTLTISVDDNYVNYAFGIGLVRGRYLLSEIEYCKPVKYTPVSWGIRLKPGYIMYIVSGTKAIDLSVRGKKRKIRIGTDYPIEFSEFINKKINKSSEAPLYSGELFVDHKHKNDIIVVALILAIIGLFLAIQNRDASLSVKDETIKISGLYGLTIQNENIASIDTVSTLPEIQIRTNGYYFPYVCKGHFKLKEVGKSMLFVNLKSSPFIVIKLDDGKTIYFNSKNPDKTINDFKKLETIVK